MFRSSLPDRVAVSGQATGQGQATGEKGVSGSEANMEAVR